MDYMQFVWAFVIGGLLCALGQLLIDITKMTSARIMVTFLVAGVVLSFLGVYKPFAEFAGAGATVPLCGFGHALYQGVNEAVMTQGLLGAFTGGLTATAGGVAAAVLFGLTVGTLASPKGKH